VEGCMGVGVILCVRESLFLFAHNFPRTGKCTIDTLSRGKNNMIIIPKTSSYL